MKVELISVTAPAIEGVTTAEDLIAYCARVSNPDNQMNKTTAPKLLRYLIKNKHWSPFEMVSMCVSIETSRAIAAQILRHRSFSFQEFSQRYAKVSELEPIEFRKQAQHDRQSSAEACDPDEVLQEVIRNYLKQGQELYSSLLANNVAKETARFILPLTTRTKLYMSGTIRSWIHYLDLRTSLHTQKEHREIALAILAIFAEQFPTIDEALGDTSYE